MERCDMSLPSSSPIATSEMPTTAALWCVACRAGSGFITHDCSWQEWLFWSSTLVQSAQRMRAVILAAATDS